MTETEQPTSPDPTANGRCLVCNVGRLGDTILSNAILDSVFQTYDKVDYLCGKHNAELLKCDSRFNRVMVLRNSLAGFASVLKGALGSVYDGYIALKDCYSTTNLALARLFRSRVKTGWNGESFHPFDRDVRSVAEPVTHKVEMMRRVGQLAGLTPGQYKPCLVLAPGSVAWFQQNYRWQEPFFFLNLSATDGSRLWPVEKWARYVQGCDLRPNSILVNALPKHQVMLEHFCQLVPGARAFRPRGFMDVAAALSEARLVLTVDTGVVHACSALNKPVVALYRGGELDVKYAPRSARKLLIQAQPGGVVGDIDPQKAAEETKRQGVLTWDAAT